MEYSRIGEEDKPPTSPSNKDSGVPVPRSKARLCQGRLRSILTSVHLYYLSIIIFFFTLYMTQRISQNRVRLSSPPMPTSNLPLLCGSTPSEALAMGCVFDSYVIGWLPAACYDPAVAKLSQNNTSDSLSLAGGSTAFPIYWDEEMTRKASLEDFRGGALVNGENGSTIRLYTAWENHRAHCLHVWRLGVSAAERLAKGERNVGVYYKAASPEHVEHCIRVIVGGGDQEHAKTATFTPGVSRCVGLDDAWNDSYAWGGRRKHT
ncbi:hypothetical protein B0O99DRAFT_529900 [Bisporella sp. PMI_857]|nr:hypothetical protein B0O99DRAFT_529900 [Bisporella sp. PMI_857]